MPLSKKRNKDRMRATRSALEAHGATQVQPKVVQPIEDAINRGVVLNPCIEIETISPKILSAVGLVQSSVQPDDIEIEEEVKPKVPLYNPQIHRAGDRVMVQKGKRLIETIIPELDADGYAVYDD